MPHLEVLELELRRFQLDVSPDHKTTLVRYCDELVRWNRKINLTGLQGAALIRRLVVEPLWVGNQLELRGVLADVGSGNGSPAIPLHLVSKLKTTHLIEARAKRAAFLRHLVNVLDLEDIVVHQNPLQMCVDEPRQVDWVTLQGVALTNKLLDSINKIATSTTKVVWITADPKPPIPPSESLRIPSTNTEVLIFHLDLS